MRAGRIVAVAVAALLMGGCNEEGPAEAEVTQPPETAAKQPPGAGAIRVEVARIEPTDAQMRLRIPGEVEGSRDALLASSLGGFVERVHVDEGDEVREGELLARVDSQVHAAKKQRTAAELAQAKRDLERAERLAGSIPEAELEAARTRLATARATHRSARLQVSRALVRAPFAGVVAQIAVEQGEVAAPGAPVVRLVKLDPAVVSLSVADRDVVALEPGMPVRLRTDARGKTYEGEVAHISPAADLKTRTFEVEVHVPNPDRELLPGMIATVELGTEVRKGRVVLPQYVLVTRREGNGVFVIEEDRAVWRPVELGPVVGGQVIVEKGVEPGERVVVTGHRELADGDAVIVARSGTCCEDGRVQFEER